MTREARTGQRRSVAGCFLWLLVALVIGAALAAAGLLLWRGVSRSERPSAPYAWRMAGVTWASKRASIRSTRASAVVSAVTA